MNGSARGLASVLLLFSASALADDPVLLPLTHLASDAAPGMYCDLQLALSAANEIVGVEYECHGTKDVKDFFPIDKIRQGVVLYHYDVLNIDVISVSAPNLDVVHGGPVVIHYLSNYLKGEYVDWEASIEPMGAAWVAYTSPSLGHQAFNDLFAVKRTVLGQLVGIQEIKTQWIP